MEFDSLDVEKDFPGLYASEGVEVKSKKNKEDSDYSEGEHDKVSRKDLLIGRRKDKKDKKDRGYAALGGESSPDEDIDAKSPSKSSKKSLAFKFTSSKSKEKREKSRDKSEKECEEKVKEKDKTDKEKDKKKDKDRKDKDKKDRSKDKEKDKSSKKTKQQTSIASEEVLELGDVQPVFGVSVILATERSRCHDGIDLPLVVRDCIDYLQEHALGNEQIYKIEPLRARLQHFKRLYNNREHQPETDELDLATACGLLKLFLRELPEPILSNDLMPRFEEVASNTHVIKQQQELQVLVEQLPKSNKTLLSWILLHFHAVIRHEKTNNINTQSLAILFSPLLQMSQGLLVALLFHCTTLFADIKIIKYVPPITASSPKLPETVEEIQRELCKQESLLESLHAEMNAGFVSKKREEQLWEVQRIITQLKRKLRTVEKLQDKSIDDNSQQQKALPPLEQNPDNDDDAAFVDVTDSLQSTAKTTSTTKLPAMLVKQRKLSASDEDDETQLVISDSLKDMAIVGETAAISSEKLSVNEIYIDEQSGFLMVPKNHDDYVTLLRLQLENQELINWKNQLQARITAERAEMLHLKQAYQQQEACLNRKSNNNNNIINNNNNDLELLEEIGDIDYERIVEQYVRENTLLEHKRNILAKEIFDEKCETLQLQVELALRQ